MLRKSTDELVIKPRLSSTARMFLIAGTIAVVSVASLAGYWGGQALVHERLDSAREKIESLEGQLRASRLQTSRQRKEFETARREMREGFETRHEQMQEQFETTRERMQSELETANRQLAADLKSTRSELEAARQRLEETRSSLTRVTRQLQIDQTAYKELRKELEASNREITELGSELKFYRSIISPADGRSGVRIQKFELQPTDTVHEYRYRLILIQALEHEDTVQGTVRFEISGTENGSARVIHSPDDSQGRISADFKYFQNFAGVFSFPAGFMPAEIKVIFEAENEAVVQRVFPWPSHEGGQNA